MTPIRSVEQTDPSRSPGETLPTMYDLPSEDPESGLPDEYHGLQPQLLSHTFRPRPYAQERIFTRARATTGSTGTSQSQARTATG